MLGAHLGAGWEPDPERTSSLLPRAVSRLTAGGFREQADGGEAEPEALPSAGGDIGLEYPVGDTGRQAGTSIGDFDHDVGAVGADRDLNRGCAVTSSGEPDEAEDVWTNAEERRPSMGRRVAALGLAIAVAGLAVVAVVIGDRRDVRPNDGDVRVQVGPATRKVMAAVGTTVDADRWNMTFAMSYAPPPDGTSGDQAPRGLTIAGHGTTNLDPFAMVAYSDVTGIGPVTTLMDGSRIWEFGGADYGAAAGGALPPAGGSAPGASIAGFAPSVEGTLGPEEGAVAMLGLGSATGYLVLVQQAIMEATPTGADSVDGVPVTLYRVSVDPTKLVGMAGTTPEEASALEDALGLLARSGFEAMTDTVAIDGSGRIRAVTDVVTFADGGVVTNRTTLSDFGCAPTVALPGTTSTTSAASCGRRGRGAPSPAPLDHPARRLTG